MNDDEARPAPTSATRPAPMRRRLLFILFVLSPLAVLAVLCWMIAVAIPRGPQMANDHRGAGGGDTGGANAIGEMLKDD